MAEETEHKEAGMVPDADPAPVPDKPPPPLPPTATALAGTAKDLKALRDALVDAANVGAGLWFSYLFVLFYLLIAVGGVTHRDLFFESPVRLPFLNVDLPLLGFFALGPAIFLIVHAYVLLHFVLLAGKVGDFDAELRAQITDEEIRRRLRRQLPSNIFVQFLAGSREVRTGRMGFLLRLIAQISLVAGPIALLVFFELQFLPYHDEVITWWHRIAVAAEIALLWMLWPSVARGERAGLSWRDLRRSKIVALAFASLVPVLLVTAIATFPGEWLDDNLPSLQLIPWKDGKDKPWRRASLHELLVADVVDFAARRPKSLWSNRLVLPGFDAIDHAKFDSEAKIEAVSETISLRARHLEGAVVIGAKLRKADFAAAHLQGADLRATDLRGAKFDCGESIFGFSQCTQLQAASLYAARLQGASLKGAQLQGASLNGAQLQGASLNGAQLQGAWLFFAQLQGASLDQVQFQGASLDQTQLQGASLVKAELQGALLSATQLQGALLNNAQLQGALLEYAQVVGASLAYVSAWRTDARFSNIWEDTSVFNPEFQPLSVVSFEKLKKMIAEQVPAGDKQRDAMRRIEQRLDPTKPMEEEGELTTFRDAWERSSPASKVYEKRLAELWRETGCAAEGTPYVIRGLLVHLANPNFPFAVLSSQESALAAAFLDEEHCPGAHGLSDAEKAKLKKIRDRSPPPAPKK